MNILDWLTKISQSTMPANGFHAHWLYIVCAVFVPAIIGALITYAIMFLERVFKIHIGGH
jgi:hypothetical protein